MDPKLTALGYMFESSKYSPALGYSGLQVLISGQSTQRFFDAKTLYIPTYDGRFYHKTQVTRHELAPMETFQVCLGEFSLESHRGEHLQGFSFGGTLQTKVDKSDLYCIFTSSAPVFKMQDDPGSVSWTIVDEIMDLLAEKEATLVGHENELYGILSRFEPYPLFLACLISLQRRNDNIPTNLRRERYQKVLSSIKRSIQIVRNTDGWDGSSPSLEELISKGGV